jgi:hypothetical protein
VFFKIPDQYCNNTFFGTENTFAAEHVLNLLMPSGNFTYDQV